MIRIIISRIIRAITIAVNWQTVVAVAAITVFAHLGRMSAAGDVDDALWRANFWEAEAGRLGRRVVELEAQRDEAQRQATKANRTLALSDAGKLLTRCSRGGPEDDFMTRRMIASLRPVAQGAADTFAAMGWTCTLDDRCSVLVEWPAYVPGGVGDFRFLPVDSVLDRAEGKRPAACDAFMLCGDRE